MRFRKDSLGVGFTGPSQMKSDLQKIATVESVVHQLPLAPQSSRAGGIVTRMAAQSIQGATFDLSEFRDMASRVRAMSTHADFLATEGATRKILDLMSPLSHDERALRDKLVDLLNSLSGAEREAAYRELELMQQIVELRERISAAKADAADARAQFDLILPEFKEKWLEVVRRSKLAPVPPSTGTAANIEALFQAYAYVTEPVMFFSRLPDEQHLEAAREAAMMMVVHMATKESSVGKIMDKVCKLELQEEDIIAAQHFTVGWMRSGFARLEIGHKLAASLALTDVPDDIEVRAPWAHWCLILPPDLMGNDSSVARVWCEGPEIRFFVSDTGKLMGPVTREQLFQKSPSEQGRLFCIACDSLVRGCCLALSNPDDYKKRSTGSSSSKSKRLREGEPDFGGARFMLSAPVTIDMREHLADYLRGGKRAGGSPAAQFLVRGHWRNQAHGPSRALRKTIWIQPFWKGDESARVLLRNYKTKEEE